MIFNSSPYEYIKMTTKNCNRCNIEKSLELFKQKKNREYLTTCIECNKKISANKRKNVAKRKQITEDEEFDENINRKCAICFTIKNLSEFNKRKNNFTKTCSECLKNKTQCQKNITITETTKQCNRCRLIKSLDDFETNKKGEKMVRCTECNTIGRERQIQRKQEEKVEIDETTEIRCIKCFEVKNIADYRVMENRRRVGTCSDCSKRHMDYLKVNRCEHGYLNKSACRLCDGASYCEHGNMRTYCIDCKGGSTCEHHYRKDRCKICCGNLYCEHNIYRTFCKDCNGGSFCEHNTRRTRCRICIGGSVCEHDKIRIICKICDFGGFLHKRVTSRVYSALKTNKSRHSIEYLDCDIETFRQHLENGFEEGMNWDNYGTDWHIDHIIPIKYQNPTIEEIEERLHYTNTQPMWAIENIKKGNRYIGKKIPTDNSLL